MERPGGNDGVGWDEGRVREWVRRRRRRRRGGRVELEEGRTIRIVLTALGDSGRLTHESLVTLRCHWNSAPPDITLSPHVVHLSCPANPCPTGNSLFCSPAFGVHCLTGLAVSFFTPNPLFGRRTLGFHSLTSKGNWGPTQPTLVPGPCTERILTPPFGSDYPIALIIQPDKH